MDKNVSMYSILCTVIPFLLACLMCCLWVNASKNRDNNQQYYEYYKGHVDEQKAK